MDLRAASWPNFLPLYEGDSLGIAASAFRLNTAIIQQLRYRSANLDNKCPVTALLAGDTGTSCQ